jgi:hypothetical protein
VIGFVVVTLCACVPSGADSPPEDAAAEMPKNLQVLPKTMTVLDVKNRMVDVAKSLGVKCSFCHNVKDYPSDENPHKQVARGMFRLVEALNRDHFNYEGAPQVTCFTCHRGDEHPLFAPAEKGKGEKG